MCSFLVYNKLTQSSISSVQFSRSVMSDSLRPHQSQHAMPPCPSPSPRVCPNSCPLRQWGCPTISSSAASFSLLPSIFPSLRVFSNESALSQQVAKVSTSASVLPVNIQDWFPLGWTGWISLQEDQTQALPQDVFGQATVPSSLSLLPWDFAPQ